MKKITVIQGTVEKILISFSYPACPSLTLNDLDFSVDFTAFGSNRPLHFEKGDLIRKLDPETGKIDFYAPIDTSVLKFGEIMMQLTAFIPDSDFEEGVRPEIQRCSTNVVIKKR